MSGAHARLSALWDALESEGAHVQRLPLHAITAHTARRMATAEERRLRILSELFTPGPRRRTIDTVDIECRIQDLAALVHHAMTTKGAA